MSGYMFCRRCGKSAVFPYPYFELVLLCDDCAPANNAAQRKRVLKILGLVLILVHTVLLVLHGYSTGEFCEANQKAGGKVVGGFAVWPPEFFLNSVARKRVRFYMGHFFRKEVGGG